MIRTTQLNINYANKNKLESLDTIITESKRVINLYIDELWKKKDFKSKFIDFKVETWLSATMLQNLGKQALEIVKSQRKKKKKHKPNFNKDSILFDSRFINTSFNLNSFDIWIRFRCIGRHLKFNIPSKKHRHFNKFKDWELKKSIRLRKYLGKYYIDLFFKKEAPEIKNFGKEVGLDIGYHKLLVSSQNKIYDKGLEKVYEKISHKKQGSKNFKQSLIERNNLINQSINTINFKELKTIVVEDLKNVKKNSKGKIYKKFNNKLQRWSYLKVLNKLSITCEEAGINLIKVNPAYTSQTCSECGFIHKDNRKGEKFLCLNCKTEMDADYNAACNILHRGAYSPSTLKI